MSYLGKLQMSYPQLFLAHAGPVFLSAENGHATTHWDDYDQHARARAGQETDADVREMRRVSWRDAGEGNRAALDA
jgi:hypothetical protein